MKTLALAIFFCFSLSRIALGADCTDPLTPQALLDLNKMHLEIQSTRTQNADPIYIAALEASFQSKLTDIARKHKIAREQITAFLNSEEKKSSSHREPIVYEKLSKNELELIDLALPLVREQQSFAKAFKKVLTQIGHGTLRESYRTAFLLLLKHANQFDITINIDEKFISDASNPDYLNLLHLSVGFEEPADTVQAILDAGADIDSEDSFHKTPLTLAVENENEFLTEFLLERGADPNIEDEVKSTVLETAAFSGNIAIAKLLLDADADINHTTEDSTTPLLMAAAEGHEEMVKFLLSRGADPTIGEDLVDATKTTKLRELLTQAIGDWQEKQGQQ